MVINRRMVAVDVVVTVDVSAMIVAFLKIVVMRWVVFVMVIVS